MKNEFTMLWKHYKIRFFNITQVEFLASPAVEKKLKLPCVSLKQRFLDLNRVAFWDVEEAEN